MFHRDEDGARSRANISKMNGLQICVMTSEKNVAPSGLEGQSGKPVLDGLKSETQALVITILDEKRYDRDEKRYRYALRSHTHRRDRIRRARRAKSTKRRAAKVDMDAADRARASRASRSSQSERTTSGWRPRTRGGSMRIRADS